jgi:hypothetical protein
MATATMKTATGFALPCPLCGREGSVKLNLADLDDFWCSECDHDITRANIEEILALWTKALQWIDLGREMAAK